MQNKRIVLLESSAYKEHKVPEVPSNRVAALSPNTVALLERLTLLTITNSVVLKIFILFFYEIFKGWEPGRLSREFEHSPSSE